MSEETEQLKLPALEWLVPTQVKDGEEVYLHLHGRAIAPWYDHVGDFTDQYNRNGSFFIGRVRRVFDEQEELIGVVIGEQYEIPENYLDLPRIIARAR